MIYYKVYNPNFYKDVKEFLNLSDELNEIKLRVEETSALLPLSEDEIKAGELNLTEKLITFTDRYEFVKHLDTISKHVQKLNFDLEGSEVRGVHWDIRALRLYLSLTCLDLFRNEQKHGDRFKNAILDCPEELKLKLSSTLKIRSEEGIEINGLEEIANFLYNIRNYYTHTGKRFHILENSDSALMQNFKVGSQKNKENKYLVIAQQVDLISIILEVAKFNVKKVFNW